MGARGRQSSASLAVVVQGDFGRRPEPPADFTEAQAQIWRDTIGSEPEDAFNTAALKGLLKDYCRHRAEAERISGIVNTFQAEWLKNSEGCKRYAALLAVRDKECRGAADKATKLRMTNQSRYTPHAAAAASKRAAKGKMPWDDE